MSVIGRLDGQLEAVLIAPLKRRGESDEDARAQGRTRGAGRTDAARIARAWSSAAARRRVARLAVVSGTCA